VSLPPQHPPGRRSRELSVAHGAATALVILHTTSLSVSSCQDINLESVYDSSK
jgi:hypothetical protein